MSVSSDRGFMGLSVLVQTYAISRLVSAPPASPSEGDCYLIASPATGAWFGQDHAIARYIDSEWIFSAPAQGYVAWVIDEERTVVYDGDGWQQLSSQGATAAGQQITNALLGALVNSLAAASDASDRPLSALDALGLAARRPVDLVMLGDSNQLYGGYGFAGGFSDALVSRFGMYATAVYTPGNANQLQGGGTSSGLHVNFAVSPSGLPVTRYEIANLGFSYVPGGQTNNNAANGLVINPVPGVNVASAWRMHCAYATVPATVGVGSFQAAIRSGIAPNTDWSVSPVISSVGDYGLSRLALDLPSSSTRATPVEFKWTSATPITGPLMMFSIRAEDVAASSGVSVSTLYGVGGQSMYDVAAKLIGIDQGKLTNYFSEVRRLQVERGFRPVVVVYVNFGLNDRAATVSPSLGWRQSTDPKSAEAYLDNLEALAKRITDVWQVNEWPVEELHWLIVPSHPVSSPDDARLVAYRQAAANFSASRPRATAIDLTTVVNFDEMSASGWYASATDRNHLLMAGYSVISQRVVAMIR